MLKRILLLLLIGLSLTDSARADWRDVFRRDPQPRFQAEQWGRFILISDFSVPIETGTRLVRELDLHHKQLEDDLKLDVPPAAALKIYLFSNQKVFSATLRKEIPSLNKQDTQREAIFLLRNGVPTLFVLNNDNLLTNLRHEYTHAYLNSAIPGLPLWLDEGLAQFYETGQKNGYNARAIKILKKNDKRWAPNLARLEKITSMADLQQASYAESWAWVAFTHAAFPEMIPAYLQELKSNPKPASFQETLQHQIPTPERNLAHWIQQLR